MVERAFTVGTAPAFSVSQWPRRSIVNEFIFVVHLLPLLRARILKIWIFFVWYLLVLVWYLFVATCPLVFVPRRLASCFSAFFPFLFCCFFHSQYACTMMPGSQSRSTTTSTSSVAWMVLLAAASVAGCAAALAVVSSSSGPPNRKRNAQEESSPSSSSSRRHLAIAFCGNSMLYFNDTPRLVQQMVEHALRIAQQQQQQEGTTTTIAAPVQVQQDSCLRGGASLPSLWEQGNGMSKKFATAQAELVDGDESRGEKFRNNNNYDGSSSSKKTKRHSNRHRTTQHDTGAASVEELLTPRPQERKAAWDFVVLNDYTQAPARAETREETVAVLREHYAPLFLSQQQSQNGRTVVPVFIQTPAYRVMGIKNSKDLGNFDEMTDRLARGLRAYVETLNQAGIPDCRIAPVGEAYRYIHRHNPELWTKLYSHDDFHPSPYGTWLQACVVYCTCFGGDGDNAAPCSRAPPIYNPLWWEKSRYMQPPDEKPLPLPTPDEAMELRHVACLVCGVNAVTDVYDA